MNDPQINELYALHFLGNEVGLTVLADFLHNVCHLWDEVEPDAVELIVRQNIGKQLLKRVGMIREDQIFELTRRLVNAPEPAQLREKRK